jgi:hypothetical protein
MLDSHGEVTVHLPIGQGVRVLRLFAQYEGGPETARAHVDTMIDVFGPVTLQLTVPGTVPFEQQGFDAVVDITTGGGRSPARMAVVLRAEDRIIARGTSDTAGRVVLPVRVSELGAPGVHTLRAEHQLATILSASTPRRVVLRARTTLTAEVVTDDETNVTLMGGLVSASGPIRQAPVQIQWRDRVVGAGLTDAEGTYRIALDPDVRSQPDVTVRAVYRPTEPWFEPSQSLPVQATAPRASSVGWAWVATPAMIALALLGILRARRRKEPAERPSLVLPDGEVVERTADGPATVARIRLQVVDAVTLEPLDPASVNWNSPGRGVLLSDQEVDAPAGARFSAEVTVQGYAPRTISAELPGGGMYTVRVGVRTWREELFDRIRRWMRRSGGASGRMLPTPREWAESRRSGVPGSARELIEHVELGVYGPVPPDAEAIRHADDLAQKL